MTDSALDPVGAAAPGPPMEEPPLDIGDGLRPVVASVPRSGVPWLLIGGAVGLGLVSFLVLASGRTPAPRDSAEPTALTTSAAAPAMTSAATNTPDFSALEAAARGQGAVLVPVAIPATPVVSPAPTPTSTPILPPAPLPSGPAQPSAAELTLAQRQKAPALVVDLGEGPSKASAETSGGPAVSGSSAGRNGAKEGQDKRPALNGDEQFAARVSGAAEPERARASMIRNQSATVAQGTMIPGVLETALNSDLPGFARAVVSRDVRSFDGSNVLIPRGSHVIGEYRSGLAQGASRAFVIWSRVIRPDGASVQIGSSGTDQLGRAGLEGDVNRHFFQRFGGAILLSVLNAGITSLTRGPSTSIVIGSSSEATSLATSALIPTNISPTIKVAQGAPIRIFVARDLDFSTVQGLAP